MQISKLKWAGVLAGALIPFFISSATDAAVVSVGATTLFANSTNQTFRILVSGADQIIGANLAVQINSGGADNLSTTNGPSITSVSLISAGTIFNGNNSGPGTFTHSSDNLVILNDVTYGGVTSVLDNGVLAYVTMNTTGFMPGTTFTVSLDGVGANLGGPFDTDLTNTSGSPFDPTGPGNGTIPAATITLVAVPEPTTALTSAFIGGAALLRRRRRVSESV